MKPIIRNLVSVIRRFQLAAALNILGLSVAFAAFMVIMMQVDYDLSFGKCHKDHDKIFRVEAGRHPAVNASMSRPFAELFINSSPHIVSGAITNSTGVNGVIPFTFYIEKDGERHLFSDNSKVVTPEFFDVFSFEFVEGLKEDRIAPGNVFIPLSMARKLFGNEPAVGKHIVHGGWGNQTVMAVYRDFPENTVVQNLAYFAIHPNERINEWTTFGYNTYIRLNNADNASLVVENFLRNFKFSDFFEGDDQHYLHNVNLRLTALNDLHFVTDVINDRVPKASKQMLLILFAIGILIIVIAVINFVNFSMAMTPMRVKNINTQRVFGAQLNTIRAAIVFESIFFCFISLFFATMFFLLFKSSQLANFVDGDMSLTGRPAILGCTALVGLLAGLLAGLYPAKYMTSFEPALVLKGSFGLSPKGKKIRSSLIGFQYAASIALIIVAAFMYMQNNFVQKSLGYDKDNLIISDIRGVNRDVFEQKMKQYIGIEDVAFSFELLNTQTSSERIFRGARDPVDDTGFQFEVFRVDPNFLELMRIPITEGRDFLPSDRDLQNGGWIFNETARKKHNLQVGSTIDIAGIGFGEIVGFIPDIKFASFHGEYTSMAFQVERPGRSWAYIRLNSGASKHEAMSYINSTLAELYPGNQNEVRFFDEVLHRLYEKEIALNLLITLFSMLVIFISIVGVFGLVMFDNESRRKEIGIRKICGATTTEILLMFNKGYLRILAVCFIITVPFAWYVVNRWLENFAYKTPMHWWVYLLAFAAVGVITVCTVTFQNWKVANDDPVKSIKSE